MEKLEEPENKGKNKSPFHIELHSTCNLGIVKETSIPFNDFLTFGKNLIITKMQSITVWTTIIKNKEIISGLQFSYKVLDNGEELKTEEFRGAVGPDDKTFKFEVKYGEYINYFQLWTDNKFIYQLEFSTNRKRIFHVGYGGGVEILTDLHKTNDILIASFGGYNDSIHSLGFYFMNRKEFKMYILKKCKNAQL